MPGRRPTSSLTTGPSPETMTLRCLSGKDFAVTPLSKTAGLQSQQIWRLNVSRHGERSISSFPATGCSRHHLGKLILVDPNHGGEAPSVEEAKSRGTSSNNLYHVPYERILKPHCQKKEKEKQRKGGFSGVRNDPPSPSNGMPAISKAQKQSIMTATEVPNHIKTLILHIKPRVL